MFQDIGYGIRKRQRKLVNPFMETPKIEITKEQINAGQKQTGNIIIIAKAALAVAGSLP
jgi:hypothetical protein